MKRAIVVDTDIVSRGTPSKRRKRDARAPKWSARL
jgi:hypothetical protein